ncbi:MAG: nucleotidyltransferase family protein [Gemmatimonadetes bacterium]|nr:nucleotidyltransferase family protein [Gemmatimonadota bacterium]
MNPPAPVDAIILAAGQSSRMERPKPLLEIGAETFIERAIRVLGEGGCRHVVAVLNGQDAQLERLVESRGATVAVNDAAGSEQLESVRRGLRALPDGWEAVAILPVDVPLVSAQTVQLLVEAFRAQPAPVLLPFHNGVAGHPVLIGRALAAEVLEYDWEEGMRSLIMAHARDLREVRVTDPGILIDVDTPDDYWRYVKDRVR